MNTKRNLLQIFHTHYRSDIVNNILDNCQYSKILKCFTYDSNFYPNEPSLHFWPVKHTQQSMYDKFVIKATYIEDIKSWYITIFWPGFKSDKTKMTQREFEDKHIKAGQRYKTVDLDDPDFGLKRIVDIMIKYYGNESKPYKNFKRRNNYRKRLLMLYTLFNNKD